MSTTYYTFIVEIDDGYGKFRAAFHYPGGGKSVVDIYDAIARELRIEELAPGEIKCISTKPQCPPSPTPSSPSTAPASCAAGPAIPPTAQPPAGFGQLSDEQLRRLDKYLSAQPLLLTNTDPYEHSTHMALHLLWKIVRPGAMMAAGTSTSAAIEKPSS